MKMLERNGYIAAYGDLRQGTDITDAEYRAIVNAFADAPLKDGYAFRLRPDLTWEEYELPTVEVETAYTAEQLADMSNDELKAILADMGISGSMTKANMIALILLKQMEE